MGDLPQRQKSILRAVIVEYISAAEPVSSEHLVHKYTLGVKSATVRNELAEMAELGYLEQPHTSAGRIPSDKAYRYYVDFMIEPGEPDATAKQRLRGATQEGDALANLLADATRTLSRLTHLLAAATVLQNSGVTVRSALVSALGPAQALLVLVFSNGHVESRILEVPPGLTLEELGRTNEVLQGHAVGKALRQLVRLRPSAEGVAPAQEKLLATVWNTVRAVARDATQGTLVVDGEEFLFAQPEFKEDPNALATLLDELKTGDVLFESLAAPADVSGTVTIGRENRHAPMKRLSVVRQTYYVGNAEAGTIALVGPTRMPYNDGIAVVNFTARALSDALTKFFG